MKMPVTNAWRLVRLYESFKCSNLEHLEALDMGDLYLLAGPKTPEAARAEVLDRAANGEQLTAIQ
jgi:hypothetical protein